MQTASSIIEFQDFFLKQEHLRKYQWEKGSGADALDKFEIHPRGISNLGFGAGHAHVNPDEVTFCCPGPN